jgi:hypothetical protein
MDIQQARDRHADVVSRYGAWTAHNIEVSPGVFTIQDGPADDDERIRRIAQVVSDLAEVPWEQMRLLDLASLEGLYGLEFALRGARVVSVEGRAENLVKAEFARDCLGLTNFETRQGDVRDLSLARDGPFDVILCLGILYHLDAPALFDFAMRLGEMTTRLLIVDTHVALRTRSVVRWGDEEWNGRRFGEHAPGSTAEEVQSRRWASLDNPVSFWLTEASLLRLLTRAGFTSIYLCRAPAQLHQAEDRITLAAIKGRRAEVRANPWPNRLDPGVFPEKIIRRPEPSWRGIAHDLLHQLGMRRSARRVLRAEERGEPRA